MRVLAMPTSAHIAVWQECYWRWCMLREMSSPTSMDTLEEGALASGDESLTLEVRAAVSHINSLLKTDHRSGRTSGTTSRCS